jgi:CBS domain-containing protein
MNATKEQTDAADEPGANQAIRPKLRVSDILDTMEQRNFTIDQHATVLDAISHLVNEKIASALVVNDESEILGIFTARDILKCIQQQNMSTEYRQRRTNFLTDISIKELMTPKQQLVYCSPSDSSRRCREIMFQCKIRSLPVIDHGEVKGIITAKHLADASFNLKDTGGKKGFIHNVTGRRGLPTGTKINQQALQKRAEHLRQNASAQLDMDIASFALPHPFKRAEGVAMSRRLYGADELSTDLSVCEDAHFALKIVDPLLAPAHAAGTDAEPPAGGWGDDASYLSSSSGAASSAAASSHSHIYLCVADGVGSWRQFGVDPRAYSHRYSTNDA